jgi:hypothetical protein
MQIGAAGGAPEMQAKLPGLQRKLLDAYTSAGMLPEAERAIAQVGGAGMRAAAAARAGRRLAPGAAQGGAAGRRAR